MELECANCGRLDGPRQNQMGVTVCEDCAWALGGNVFGGLEALPGPAAKAQPAIGQGSGLQRIDVAQVLPARRRA